MNNDVTSEQLSLCEVLSHHQQLAEAVTAAMQYIYIQITKFSFGSQTFRIHDANVFILSFNIEPDQKVLCFLKIGVNLSCSIVALRHYTSE